MTVCRKCGARLPSFGFGELKEDCRLCTPTAPAKKRENILDGIPEPAALPFPWLTSTRCLLGMNLAVFLAMLTAGVSPVDPGPAELIKWGADFGPLTFDGQYWRLFTSAFVHVGILHLALNMWCLWRLGTLAERLLGQVTTIGIYLVGGGGASLLSLSWDATRVSAGASGAIFGIVGVLISVLHFAQMDLTAEKRRSLYSYVVRFAILNLIIGLTANIDNMAHVGGLVTGLLLGFFLARTIPQTEDFMGRRGKIILAGVLVIALIFIPVAAAKRYVVEGKLGSEALDRGDYTTAIRHFQEYVKLAGGDPAGHTGLGYALVRLERYPEAMVVYERALAIDPQYPTIEENLAGLYLQANRVKDAVAMYARAVTRKEADSGTFKGYGRALLADGNPNLAESMLRRSIIDNGADPETYLYLAEALTAGGKEDEAAQARKKASEIEEKWRKENPEKE
jgi:membrane associated rhomboid family serine protease/Flp pilus assembly protein TadD